jgi:hypothetical protein
MSTEQENYSEERAEEIKLREIDSFVVEIRQFCVEGLFLGVIFSFVC